MYPPVITEKSAIEKLLDDLGLILAAIRNELVEMRQRLDKLDWADKSKESKLQSIDTYTDADGETHCKLCNKLVD